MISKTELHKMDKYSIEMSMQLKQDNLLEVAMVGVGQHVEQKTVNLADLSIEPRGKLVSMLGRESGLIIDWLLDVSHDVINVLRSWQSRLFAFFIYPKVLPKGLKWQIKTGQDLHLVCIYLGPGPTISGQEDGVQNSEMVP